MTNAERHLMTLFAEALELASPPERAAYLDRACGDDQALRQQVEGLLQAHAQVGRFLEPQEAAAGATSSAAGVGIAAAPGDDQTTLPRPAAETAGTVIGPYKLVEQIGEGGMGSVWMAQQTQPVKRLVAVKLIKAGMDSKQVIARFEAERQALALMDHPNIAKVLDGGTTDAGRPYFVMDLVRGVPITRYCDEHHLTPQQRLELFLPVCQAVQHAHQKGIIHRDLKPSNVLVPLYDGKPVPKVIDFGVAKAAGQSLTDKTLVTGFGNIVGTLEYMSPEQAEVNQLDIDTRSDIYSLGVLLYELLTGSPPFSRKELEKAGMLEMLRVIREQEPSKPSTKLSTAEGLPTLAANRGTEPAKLTRLVCGELDWIVMKALEKDRNRRYETANGFALDVQRYLADEPVQACPPSAWYRLGKFARRHKGRLAVAACLFLAVTVMAATIGWALHHRAVREAEIEAAEISRRATVAVQVRDSLSVARALIGENKLTTARLKLAEARAQLGQDRAALGDLAAEVEAGAAELERFQEFLDLMDRAHEAETAPIIEAVLAADGSQSIVRTLPSVSTRDRQRAAAAVLRLEGLARYAILERDDWSSTLEGGLLGRDQMEQIRRTVYEELLWLASDVQARRREHRAGAHLSAKAAARQGLAYLGKAESGHPPTQAFYVLRARCRKALGDEAAAQADQQRADRTVPTIALDQHLRGQAAYDAKQLAEAVAAFEAALRLDPTHYWSLIQLGGVLCDLGRGPEDFAGAARVFTGCILNRPDHAHAYYCRAIAHTKLGRYEDALADCSKAIELDPKRAESWSQRGAAYDQVAQPDKAIADCSKAIELDPKCASAWINRGVAYSMLGQPGKAVADCSKAIELDPKRAEAWYNRGTAYRKLGQADKAVADFSMAIELDPNIVSTWINRGGTYCDDLTQYDKALADFSKAIELDPKNAAPWHCRGNAHSKLGQWDKAVADYSRATELDPKNAEAWYNRGNAYLALGRPDRAVADCSRAIELDPKGVAAWVNRGVAYGKLGQWEKALADLSKAIELEPKGAAGWGKRAVAYSSLGHQANALADLSKAIELEPKNAAHWHNRGIIYRRLGECDKAIADYSEAIRLKPTYADAWCARGFAYLNLGQFDKAVADYSKAIELSPNNSRPFDLYLLRAQANCRLVQFAQARADYESALKRAPGNASILNELAWLLATCPDAKVGDPRRAVELARKAVEAAPRAGDYWNTMGVAHYRAGDWKAAVTALDKSVQLRQGGDAVDHLFLAMAYVQLGNRDQARKAYDQAIQWLERHKETMEKNKPQAEELRRFRTEAEEVLELKKK